MITVRVQVDAVVFTVFVALDDAVAGEAMAIKEALAMFLEQWGDAKVVEITEATPEQLKID